MQTTHFLCLARPPRPTFPADATPAEMEIMGRHFAWLKGLREHGKLLLAGPCLDGTYGVAIFTTADAAEAQRIMESDPAVIEGLFKSEIHPMSIGAFAPVA